MRKWLPGKEVLLLILLVAVAWLLATNGKQFVRKVNSRMEQRVEDAQANLSAVRELLRTAAPRAAEYTADFVLGAGAVAFLLFLQLLVTTPLGLLKLHRRVRGIERQLAELGEGLKRNNQMMEGTLALRHRAEPLPEPWLDPAPRPSSPTDMFRDSQGD
jgi:hypothetical protein